MSTIYLARHGETTWNVAGRYQGQLESELSERGVAQAAALAAAFSAKGQTTDQIPTRIISSRLLRCRTTAAPLAQALGLTVEIDERLIEIGHGSWEGLTREEIEQRDPELYRRWREKPSDVVFPGGESLQDVAERWRSFAKDVANSAGPVLIVSHDAVVRVALLELCGRPLNDLWKIHVENAGFAVIERVAEGLKLREEMRVAHLKHLRASILNQAL